MNTALLLMAQYGGKAIIPIDEVCRDYFSHLTPTKLVRKFPLARLPFRWCGSRTARSVPRASILPI